MAREGDIAWAAGLYEGEGSAHISSAQGQTIVQLRMTDEDVVQRFAQIVGRGNVVRRSRSQAQGPRKDVWCWSIHGAEDVKAVLGMLWPYLGERRQQRATEVLERASKIGEDDGFCQRGHDLALPEHCYVHAKTGKRHCRTCRRERQRRYEMRRRSLRLVA